MIDRNNSLGKAMGDSRPRGEAIQLVADNPDGGFKGPMRFRLVLVVFMRILSAVWIFRGLVQWMAILTPTQGGFETIAAPAQIAVVFFAVFDLIAAVGLWLAAPWGGVLWLFAVAAQFFCTMLIVDFASGGWVAWVLDGLLVVIYFGLTFFAARERSE